METQKGNNLQVGRVFDRVADFCNQLPFAGKILTAPTTTAAIKERNPYYKTVKTIQAAGVLGVLALGHSIQAGTGLSRISHNMELLKHHPSPETLWAFGIDVAYTAANVAATYTQLHLSGRLREHFMRSKAKAVPNLLEWGVNGDEVDYDSVAENLMTAIVNGDQGNIDTFFMILPKDKKQRVMESVKAITEVVDETYSYGEINKKITQLESAIENKSKSRYILEILKNTHSINDFANFYSHYGFKENMKMLITTLGGQIGFHVWG